MNGPPLLFGSATNDWLDPYVQQIDLRKTC